jgi:hypothetical protein
MKYYLATLILLFAAPAFAEETVLLAATGVSQDFSVESEQVRQQRATLELKPLTTLSSSVPGVGAFGASFEIMASQRWGVFVDGAYADANLKDVWIGTVEDETNQPSPTRGFGYTVGTGLRYYDDPLGNSMYAGGSIAYGESQTKWSYGDAEYDVDVYAAAPGIFAGYRWIWSNGVLLRLGAGLSSPTIDTEHLTNLMGTGKKHPSSLGHQPSCQDSTEE